MRALIHNLSTLDHNNQIGIADRAEAIRDVPFVKKNGILGEKRRPFGEKNGISWWKGGHSWPREVVFRIALQRW
jgi:hypothetical protein